MNSQQSNIHSVPRWIQLIDALNDAFAWIAKWALMLACVISGLNAIARYALGTSSNAWLEIQWYLFAAGVMLGAAQVLRLNQHVRVDLLYGRLPSSAKAWFDLAGTVVLLIPVMALFAYLSWPVLQHMFESGERSPNVGGLVRWPAMILLPIGFSLVCLQGLSEIGKRMLWLQGRLEMSNEYERPLQ